MVTIRILEHVRSVSSYGDGEVIYRIIVEEFRHHRPVTLSFDGIKSVSSAFVNSALIRLIEDFDFDFIRAHLHIVDSTRQINRIIKDRFAFATGDETEPKSQSDKDRQQLH